MSNMCAVCVVWSLVILVTCGVGGANQCGVPVGMSKIVGGEAVPTLRYPWYVALVQTDIFDPPLSVSCGGSLITNRHVLTAAHCFPRIQGMRPEQLYRAVFALVNRCGQGRYDSSSLQKVDIFPSFNQKTLQGDVAVITLPRRVQYMPICLPPKHSTVSGPALVIGFGSTMAKSQYPCILQEATVDILTRKQCQKSALESQFSGLPGIYCAGVSGGGIDSCDGDSGGPLQTASSSGVYTIQGIVSFGEGCARKNLPGVYTQVSFYRDFIDKVVLSTSPYDDLPQDHPVEPEEGVDQESPFQALQPLNPLTPLVPQKPFAPFPPLSPQVPSNHPSGTSLTSLFQAWFQGLFHPLANTAAVFSSSGSRFPSISGPASHRPFTSIQAIIQNIFNRRRLSLGGQSMIQG